MASEELPVEPSAQAQKLRQIAPTVIAIILVALIVISILPSALNLPQTNPSTVLEYAPVPPEDESPPISLSGGLSSLGIAGSSSLTGGDEEPPKPATGQNLPPIQQQKRCVGGRQTDDPNSPPCQSSFQGDNFGKTWQGVTPDEITILFTANVGNVIDTGQGTVEPTPGNGTYCDVEFLDCDGDGQPDDDPHQWMEIMHAFSRYFNARFQTYNRYVHFWAYWTGANSEGTRKGAAQDNWTTLKPFAVITNFWTGGFTQAYQEAMAQRGVLVLDAVKPENRDFYARNAPRLWNFWPDVENWADAYTNYVCDKVKDSKVSHGPFSGQPRVYGTLGTNDPAFKNYQNFRSLALQGLSGCGIQSKADLLFPFSGFWFDNSRRRQMQSQAVTNCAAFQDADVNTILWIGGVETHHSEACDAINYYPEVVVAGEGDHDGRGYATRQEQTFWANAWSYSFQVKEDNREAGPGWQAYKEADPDGTNERWAIPLYRPTFMTFTAIQVAGPKLRPDTVDAGFHAIQRRRSTDPYVASLFFHPNDYSAVKDGTELWWNPNKESPDNHPGCYQMVRAGQRFLYDEWNLARGAGIDVVGYNANEPCTNYGGTGVTFDPA
jgi:hypothetical protein